MNQIQIQSLPPQLIDLTEVLDFVFTTVETIKLAKEDGNGLEISDISKVFKLIDAGTLAYEGIENIPAAWRNATDEEKAVVHNYFVLRFDLTDDNVEAKIEQGVKIAYLLMDLLVK